MQGTLPLLNPDTVQFIHALSCISWLDKLVGLLSVSHITKIGKAIMDNGGNNFTKGAEITLTNL